MGNEKVDKGLNMKYILNILFVLTIFTSSCTASQKFDQSKFDKAQIVLRVKVIKLGYGDKYHWQKVEILSVLKNKPNEQFKKTLMVAYYGWEPWIPLGVSTIYLEPYRSQGDYWRLLDASGTTGVSHTHK